MRKTSLSVALCAIFGVPAALSAGPAWADEDVASLRELVNRQGRLIERLESRLRGLELERDVAVRGARGATVGVRDASLDEIRGRGPGTAQAGGGQVQAQAPTQAQPSQPAAAPAGQQAPAGTESRGDAERNLYDIKLLARQPAIFEKRLTVEAGLSYARYDRRQLALSGFYALDAIFLGNLSVDQVKGDSYTWDATLRYGITDTVGVDLTLPWVRRSNVYLSGGASSSPTQLTEAHVATDALGDVGVGVSVQLARESRGEADVVASLRVRLPTGEDPFGIRTRMVLGPNGDPTSLTVPTRLPTGSGFRTWQAGLAVLKTFDPVVLYGNVGYAISERGTFDDISAGGGVSGQVRAGNTLSLGGGMVLALNDTTAYSLGMSMQSTQTTRTRVGEGDWSGVVGSAGHAASVNLGVTHALSPQLSMVTGVGIGLTADAPNYTFAMRFPYRF